MINVFIVAVVAISATLVYLDATKNNIGKISNAKGMFNMSAGAWGTVTLLLWFIGLPAYLIKRGDLVLKAKENPVVATGRRGKAAVLAGIGCIWVFMTIAGITSVPKCGDQDATKLVKQIANREMGKQLGAEAAQLFSYTVGTIRTTSTNEQTGAHQCAAQLGITASNTGQTNEIPITYTVEMTDTGKEFYVTVFGL
jgi:hypothetical protein